MSNNLKIAIEAARVGAKIAVGYFNSGLKVEIKSNNTPVTIADRETENAIKNYISKKYPNSKFLAEESGGNTNEGDFWIIDPIDGTKNYVRGIPFWAILLAHCKNGKIKEGVSYTPLVNELIYAQLGQGAYLNGEKVIVSKVSHIEDAFISYGDIMTLKEDKISRLSKRCVSSRGFGDAYSYHLVASGRIDIMVENENSAWDVAPFKVIIEEAGGKVTTIEGSDWKFSDKSCIATNGLLHDEVVKVYNN